MFRYPGTALEAALSLCGGEGRYQRQAAEHQERHLDGAQPGEKQPRGEIHPGGLERRLGGLVIAGEKFGNCNCLLYCIAGFVSSSSPSQNITTVLTVKTNGSWKHFNILFFGIIGFEKNCPEMFCQ